MWQPKPGTIGLKEQKEEKEKKHLKGFISLIQIVPGEQKKNKETQQGGRYKEQGFSFSFGKKHDSAPQDIHKNSQILTRLCWRLCL